MSEEVVIIKGGCGDRERFETLGEGLDVSFREGEQGDLAVRGPDLHEYLRLLDPITWDPESSVGDC